MRGGWKKSDACFIDFEVSPQSQCIQSDAYKLTLEGSIFRFLDSKISYDFKDPLGSLEKLLAEKGEDFVRHVDGLFLFLLEDLKHGRAFLVNNRQQAHRLYYHLQGEDFFFSDKMKDLLQRAGLRPEPNFASIRSFLSNGFSSSEQTQLRGVSKLLPADYVVFSDKGAEIKSYWQGLLKFRRQKFQDLESHLDLYEQTYRQGIERYLDIARPQEIGCLLSGGHDTSYAFLQLSKIFDKPVHAYTVTFPGWNFDEGQFAKNIADKFGGQFHSIPFGAEHIDETLDLIHANEEPVVGSSLPLHVLSKQAGQTVSTLFGGDGGDTLWGEYYPVGEYHRWVRSWPLGARRAAYVVSKGLRKVTDWERFWELEHVASLFSADDYHEDFLRKLCTYRHFSDGYQGELLRDDIFRTSPARSRLEIPFRNDNFSEALIEGKLFNGFYTYQAFHTAKSAEHFGMDLFLPTTQTDLIEFITSLPQEWVNGGSTFQRLTNSKVINRKFHKKVLNRYLKRDEIYNRSFDIPWYNILKPRKRLLERLQFALKRRGWYKEEALDRLFAEFREQKAKSGELLELKHHGYRVFTLLSLEIWSQIYLDGKDQKSGPIEEFIV